MPHRRGNRAAERGSSPVEFVLVGALLTLLTLGVLQVGLAVYVRNVVHDAAVEGAYTAALADTTIADGVVRTRAVIARAVGAEFAQDVRGRWIRVGDQSLARITVRSRFPVVGPWGIDGMLEVHGDAPRESL